MEYDRADKEVAEMSKIKVNEQRAVDEFQELTAIDAPSFGERQMADRLIVKLKELGFEVEEDNAGGHFGGNAGNLFLLVLNSWSESTFFLLILTAIPEFSSGSLTVHTALS